MQKKKMISNLIAFMLTTPTTPADREMAGRT